MYLPDVMTFIMKDRTWDSVPIGLLKGIIYQLCKVGQIEFLRTGSADGPAEMLLMWTWLQPDAERRYAENGFVALRPSDIGKEGNLWLIGLSAPGGVDHLIMALRWAGKIIPEHDGKERLRCLAPVEENKKPQPVALFFEGSGRGSIKPIHV